MLGNLNQVQYVDPTRPPMNTQRATPMAPERLKLFEEEMVAWQKVEVWLGPGVNSPENAEKHSAEAVRKYEFRQGGGI